ncbi:MAG: rod shape-determining protein MreC [Candidatus Omnitrophota bacterium]
MKRFHPILAVLLLIFILSALVIKPAAVKTLTIKAMDVLSFPLKAAGRISGSLADVLMPKNRYERRIMALQKKVSALNGRLIQLKDIEMENERLSGLLSFKKKFSYVTVASRVIGRDPSGWGSVIIIGKGKEHGIAPDMAVCTDEGLIGKVIETGASWAKVMLIDDPDFSVGVIVQRTRELCIGKGAGGGVCKLVHLSPNDDLKVGDKIVTAGVGNIFPKGIFVGVVSDISRERSSGQPEFYATIEPAADLFKVEEVLCLK